MTALGATIASDLLRPAHCDLEDPESRVREIDGELVATEDRLRIGRARRAQLLSRIDKHIDPLELGFSHRHDFAREVLGVSNRTWQESCRTWKRLESLPLTRSVFSAGLISEAKLSVILSVLSATNEATWLRRSSRFSVETLRRLTRQHLREEEEHRRSRDHLPNPAALGLESPVVLAVAAPSRTEWLYHSFAETISRRVGHRTTSDQVIGLAVAEFESSSLCDSAFELRRKVHWPPLFVTTTDPRSHNAVPDGNPSSSRSLRRRVKGASRAVAERDIADSIQYRAPVLDTYVFGTTGDDICALPRRRRRGVGCGARKWDILCAPPINHGPERLAGHGYRASTFRTCN